MSVFTKIFTALLLAIGLTIVATVWLYPPAKRPLPPIARDLRHSSAIVGQFIAQLVEDGKVEEARQYWKRTTELEDISLYLFRENQQIFGPQASAQVLAMLDQDSTREERDGDTIIVRTDIPAKSGAPYVLIASAGAPGPRVKPVAQDLVPRLLILLLVFALVSYALARYLTTPIIALRQTARRLAKGELSARAVPVHGKDEIASLVADFNVMAQRIEDLVNTQNRLTSDISHELRSPLARLSVALELARAKASDESQPALDRIEIESERLNELVGQILMLSKLESTSEPEGLSRFELVPLIEEVVNDGSFEGSHKSCTLSFDAQGSCWMNGNRELLRRAFDNVIRNAISYSPENSTIEVSFRCPETGANPTAQIRIRDHGPGVPIEDLQRIFEPFHRAASDRARQTGGAGLGLAISDRAVRLHHGSISSQNAPDGGLVTTITLPVLPSGRS